MPGDRPYTRREMSGMSDRQLMRALGRRTGGQLSAEERRRLGRLARRDVVRWAEEHSGAQFTDEERKRRLGGRSSPQEVQEGRARVREMARSRSGAQFTDEEWKRRQNRTVGGRQGYNDREDESLGMRRGPERDSSQSFRDRRDESYGRWGTRDARRRRGER